MTASLRVAGERHRNGRCQQAQANRRQSPQTTQRVEGAYFDQPRGPPKYGVFSASSPGLVDPRDGNLWLGGGIVLVVVAVSVAIWSRLMLVRRASPPD